LIDIVGFSSRNQPAALVDYRTRNEWPIGVKSRHTLNRLQGTVVGSTRPSKADRSIAIRGILLALLLAAGNLWCVRHLGYGFEDPLSLLGLTSFVTVGSFGLDLFVDAGEHKALTASARDRLQGVLRRYLLATPTLVVLYMIAIVGACTYSSVTLVPPAQGNPLTVKISPLSSGTSVETSLQPGGEADRHLLVSNPFGSEYRLSVSGYLDETRILFPLVGLTIDIDKDLQPLPTILLRPPLEAVLSLEGGGTARIYLKSGSGCALIAKSDPNKVKGAFTLGAQRAVPANLPVLWELELRGREVEDPNLARTMGAWQQAVPIAASKPLPSGLKAIADIIVGDEPFQDVPMKDAPAQTTVCH